MFHQPQKLIVFLPANGTSETIATESFTMFSATGIIYFLINSRGSQ